jgi:hypothetical protein
MDWRRIVIIASGRQPLPICAKMSALLQIAWRLIPVYFQWRERFLPRRHQDVTSRLRVLMQFRKPIYGQVVSALAHAPISTDDAGR